METDRSKLAHQIQSAEQAVSARERELNRNGGWTEDERSAIRDALSGLKVLRDEFKRDVSEGAFEFDSEEDVARDSHSGRYSQKQE